MSRRLWRQEVLPTGARSSCEPRAPETQPSQARRSKMDAGLGSKVEDKWVPGQSLSRHYYTSPEIFEQDVRMLGETQWLMVDHVSRIPNVGDYFLFDFGHENIIIVRDKSNSINAFYNVCRHRGSRVC